METKSLGCAQCGNCCEKISLSTTLESLAGWTTEVLDAYPHDPRTPEGWAHWSQDPQWAVHSQEYAVKLYDPEGPRRRDADFLVKHWTLTDPENKTHSCDAFDPVHRVCTAHDDRPPVCSEYPWYHWGPRQGDISTTHCSYLLDLPPAQRPEGSYPLIPIEVIRG